MGLFLLHGPALGGPVAKLFPVVVVGLACMQLPLLPCVGAVPGPHCWGGIAVWVILQPGLPEQTLTLLSPVLFPSFLLHWACRVFRSISRHTGFEATLNTEFIVHRFSDHFWLAGLGLPNIFSPLRIKQKACETNSSPFSGLMSRSQSYSENG